MEYLAVIIVAAVVFGVCFLIDKAFIKLFRSQAQHFSGMSVRLSKRYGSIGLILAVLGIAAVFLGFNGEDGLVLSVGGGVLIAVGIGLVVYYMTFGVFYDANSFILTRFGKPSITYMYKDIQSQQLYNNQGHTLIEIYLKDGNTLQLQSTMTGVYSFMDHAFCAWCRQTGRKEEDCKFHDPDNSCWFPPVEG